IQLMDMVLEEFGEERAMAKLRSIVPRFISGCWNCRDLRRTLSSCEVRNREAVVRILEEVDSEMGHKRVNSYARPAGCDE
ncbi:MAG: tRNA pseudouridine synthase B, partial [Candidatus Methanomethylophilaceae archaeon]|nr:tRNA pseudouridine synthase B [Candidatus Methanomethylophilaceae archaeon]